jgi:hypothetical protein
MIVTLILYSHTAINTVATDVPLSYDPVKTDRDAFEGATVFSLAGKQ